MALGGCYTCLKYLMFTFNFIFWLVGCALLAVGIWAKVSESSLSNVISHSDVAQSLHALSIVVIVIGCIVLILGFLGCCGAIRESQCMLATFFVFLAIIFAALLALGIYAYVKRDDGKEQLEKFYGERVKEYNNPNNESRTIMDDLHKHFDCCGAVKGDMEKEYGASVAEKACGADFRKQEGCVDAIQKALEHDAVIIVGVAIAIAIIMLLGMIFSMLLCCAIREAE